MPNPDLIAQLESLLGIQQIDLQILALNKQIQAVPLKIKKLEQNLETHKVQLKATEDALLEAEKEQRTKTSQLQVELEQRRKYEAQLREVKTNKEYQALDKEISFLQEKEEELEDGILGAMLQIDQLKEELQAHHQAFDETQAKNETQRGKYQQESTDLKSQIVAHQAERRDFLPQIDLDLMKRYQVWIKHHGTGFVSLVEDNACGSCRIAIPPQLVKEARAYERMVFCPSCRRILYAPPPTAAEEESA
jgi:uncharacterized protein